MNCAKTAATIASSTRIDVDAMTTAFAVERPTPSAPAAVTYPSYEHTTAMAPPKHTALITLYTTWNGAKLRRSPSPSSR